MGELTDEQKIEFLGRWLRGRPENIQALSREWPPTGRVKAKQGVTLMVPSPGVEGTVNGYTEDGLLMISAPSSIPHPEHGWPKDPETGEELAHGTMLQAEVNPDQLRYIGDGLVSREKVAELLDG